MSKVPCLYGTSYFVCNKHRIFSFFITPDKKQEKNRAKRDVCRSYARLRRAKQDKFRKVKANRLFFHPSIVLHNFAAKSSILFEKRTVSHARTASAALAALPPTNIISFLARIVKETSVFSRTFHEFSLSISAANRLRTSKRHFKSHFPAWKAFPTR